MARVLIVGGGERGLQLTRALATAGHAVRVTTRNEQRRKLIAEAGGECWIGTPERLATLRGALEGVTVVYWLLGTASGTSEQIGQLHSSRLEFFLGQIIDTTVRGFVYELPSKSLAGGLDARGGEIVRRLTRLNSIPCQVIEVDQPEHQWLVDAQAALASLLA